MNCMFSLWLFIIMVWLDLLSWGSTGRLGKENFRVDPNCRMSHFAYLLLFDQIKGWNNGRKWFGMWVQRHWDAAACYTHKISVTTLISELLQCLKSAYVLLYLEQSERVRNPQLDRFLQHKCIIEASGYASRLLDNFCKWFDLSSSASLCG